ncbi:MAG: DegT/DnrJ/EryC1/StrS family aminotransferase [Chloroflexota bacterium]
MHNLHEAKTNLMIPVCEPVFDGNEAAYVADCIQTGWVSSGGAYIDRFEEMFSAYCGMPYGVAVTSGTTALHLALTALGIGAGDEVIIPDFTLIVSANVVIQVGARPVLIDADPQTWCMDAAQIEAKITPATKAIMAVHLYGHPCDMVALKAIAERHNLYLIEDCAEAHGSEVNGQRVGSLSDAGCFSFYGNKTLTTGEGGMVVCRDPALAERMRLLRNQGFREPRFVHDVVAFNYRMTNVQAAIGVAQTEKADEKIESKRWIARTYTELLGGEAELILPYEASWAKNTYWMYGVLLRDGFGRSKDDVMHMLKMNGVDTRSFFCPMHLQPVFANGNNSTYPDVAGQYPVSEDLWKRGFYLPTGVGLTRAQIEEVAAKLLECKA